MFFQGTTFVQFFMYCKAKKNFGVIRNFLKFFDFQKLLSKLGPSCGGFQFIVIMTPQGVPFYPVVVIGLCKILLFKSVLGHCEGLLRFLPKSEKGGGIPPCPPPPHTRSNGPEWSLIQHRKNVMCSARYSFFSCSESWQEINQIILQKNKQYFVTKIVLTYCEKKLFQ